MTQNPSQAELERLVRLIKRVHTSKGRYHTQIAMCDLFEAVGLKAFRPNEQQVEASMTVVPLEGDQLAVNRARSSVTSDEHEALTFHELPSQEAPKTKITIEQAREMGAKGGAIDEHERLLFEAWMRGHCWAIQGDWDGSTYVHASERNLRQIHPAAMNTRQLWAAWRDRAALERVDV